MPDDNNTAKQTKKRKKEDPELISESYMSEPDAS